MLQIFDKTRIISNVSSTKILFLVEKFGKNIDKKIKITTVTHYTVFCKIYIEKSMLLSPSNLKYSSSLLEQTQKQKIGTYIL